MATHKSLTEAAMHKRREARRPRIKRGATLRPSDDTPLWNALISLVGPKLRRRGARALLARDDAAPPAGHAVSLPPAHPQIPSA